jgi:hypothetical protein
MKNLVSLEYIGKRRKRAKIEGKTPKETVTLPERVPARLERGGENYFLKRSEWVPVRSSVRTSDSSVIL